MTTETLEMTVRYKFGEKMPTKDELAIARNGTTIKPHKITTDGDASYYFIHDQFSDVIEAKKTKHTAPERQCSYFPTDEFLALAASFTDQVGYDAQIIRVALPNKFH